METLIIVIVGLVALGAVIQAVAKGAATARGRDRCAFCGARLKKAPAGKWGYADHCAKCGRPQPWAQAQA